MELEQAAIAAFKAKGDQEFTKYFSKDHVGIDVTIATLRRAINCTSWRMQIRVLPDARTCNPA